MLKWPLYFSHWPYSYNTGTILTFKPSFFVVVISSSQAFSAEHVKKVLKAMIEFDLQPGKVGFRVELVSSKMPFEFDSNPTCAHRNQMVIESN